MHNDNKMQSNLNQKSLVFKEQFWICLLSFLIYSTFLALFDVRQWSKSEKSSSLALWFPKKDLEKQVG